jgi:hypothetical protein
MTAFLLGLLLKIFMTTGIVVAASVVVDRSGPFIGALIASLPTVRGATLIIALEHPRPSWRKARWGAWLPTRSAL